MGRREEEKGEQGRKDTNYVLFRRINQQMLKEQNRLITTALANNVTFLILNVINNIPSLNCKAWITDTELCRKTQHTD